MSRVMIVDDALTVRLYHRQILEGAGLEVVEASNGVEALEKAHGDNIDLFVVDINMPKMDGFCLTSELRQSESLRSVPVIVISTESRGRYLEQAYDSGANLFLVEPCQPEILQAHARLLAGGGAP